MAQLDGLTGKRGPALARLHELAADAAKRQWLDWSLEARLATYDVLAQAHDPAAAARRGELETDARKRGFGWVLERLGSATTSQ